MSFRRLREEGEEQTEVNLTPMLDVVFIMLIFFIVTASFVREPGASVERPGAETAQKLERASILIALTDTNQIWIDKRQIDLRSVRSTVERMLIENPQSAVVVQADEQSNHGSFVQIVDEVRAAGAERIFISATEEL